MKAQELAFFGYADAHEKIYTAAILHRQGSRREYFLSCPDLLLSADRQPLRRECERQKNTGLQFNLSLFLVKQIVLSKLPPPLSLVLLLCCKEYNGFKRLEPHPAPALSTVASVAPTNIQRQDSSWTITINVERMRALHFEVFLQPTNDRTYEWHIRRAWQAFQSRRERWDAASSGARNFR